MMMRFSLFEWGGVCAFASAICIMVTVPFDQKCCVHCVKPREEKKTLTVSSSIECGTNCSAHARPAFAPDARGPAKDSASGVPVEVGRIAESEEGLSITQDKQEWSSKVCSVVVTISWFGWGGKV